MSEPEGPLLRVRGLKKYFPIKGGVLGTVSGYVRAVDDVSFDLWPGKSLGLAGESGSGKTTLGRVILRALQPTAGQVLFRLDGRVLDLAQMTHQQLKPIRRHMQMIFQDPYSSLNPRMTVLDIVGEPLLLSGVKARRERERQVRDLLREVGLRPQYLRRYPHAFSGGQRQRIGIARALALRPRLIVADEPVSALDVSVRAQVLNLLQELQERFRLTYLLIAHDLSVLRHIADRVAVMYVGRLVESAATEALFTRPRHPYTEALLSAAPVLWGHEKDLFVSPTRPKPILLSGEVADPSDPPAGCPFHPRCPYARDICHTSLPEFREIEPGHEVRCHLAEGLALQGMRD